MIATSMTRPGRLTHPRDIAAVLRGGRRRAGRLVALHARDRSDVRSDGAAPTPPTGPVTDETRFAVVASRKVGSAVARNRAKRVMREAAARIDWEPGHDLVLVARNACATSRMPEVLAELEQLASDLELRGHAA